MKLSKLSKLDELVFFTKEVLSRLDPDTTPKALEQNITRWLKKGNIIQIKRGIYIKSQRHEYSSNRQKLIDTGHNYYFFTYI